MLTPYYQDSAVTIYHGDCREILPQLPKVDLVLTDPPYPKEFLGCWDYLNLVNTNTNAHLLTLFGHFQLPHVIDTLRKSWNYRWLCIVENNGCQPLMHGWNIKVCFKPIIWMVRGKPETTDYMRDNFCIRRGSFAEAKRLHGWGQAIFMEPFICLSGLILDPSWVPALLSAPRRI
jgi:hypothetical protein